MQLTDPSFKAMLIALTDSLLLENWSILSEIVVWFFLTAQSILFLDCRYHEFVLLRGASGNIKLSMNDVRGKLIGGISSALSRELEADGSFLGSCKVVADDQSWHQCPQCEDRDTFLGPSLKNFVLRT